MAHFAPRTVFVSGASAGIGQAIARQALATGAEVWGSARRRERLAEFDGESRFHPVELDLEDGTGAVQAYREAAAAAGGFDVVVNNAGYGIFAPFAATDFETWSRQLQAMLVNTAALVHAQLKEMQTRGTPAIIVNTASLAVEFPLPYMSGYNIAKAGLSALSESLLIETAGSPIRVIDYRPGDVCTGFHDALRRPAVDAGERMETAYQALDRNLRASPPPEKVAAQLWRAVQRGHRGVLRSGSVFQTVLAPLYQRLVPLAWARATRWRYFGLR